MIFLVTGMVEVYQFVEADSEEDARDNIDAHGWRPTMNHPIQNLKVKVGEVETTGEEVK